MQEKKAHEYGLKNVIPPYYEDQMLHQLNCCKTVLQVYYFTYRPEHEKKYTIQTVFPNYARQKEMITKENLFRLCVKLEIPPEKPWEFGK